MEHPKQSRRLIILVDEHLRGQALLLQGALAAQGWLELLGLHLATFEEVGLSEGSDERAVWRFVQTQGMLLLTGNRQMKGPDSREQTIREENSSAALPVLTIGRIDRLDERAYREGCSRRLVEIVFDIESYLGAGRMFIP